MLGKDGKIINSDPLWSINDTDTDSHSQFHDLHNMAQCGHNQVIIILFGGIYLHQTSTFGSLSIPLKIMLYLVCQCSIDLYVVPRVFFRLRSLLRSVPIVTLPITRSRMLSSAGQLHSLQVSS